MSSLRVIAQSEAEAGGRRLKDVVRWSRPITKEAALAVDVTGTPEAGTLGTPGGMEGNGIVSGKFVMREIHEKAEICETRARPEPEIRGMRETCGAETARRLRLVGAKTGEHEGRVLRDPSSR
mmetsp:Transcript_37243/g.99137  ORF Transcript_37243/g.99137 Transcript_37243/m.99137 type:complete len:123 (-) Transcript_37243:229-597(-)